MTRDPIWIHPEAPLSDLVEAFVSWRLAALPVVDRELRPIGIVSYVDLLAELANRRVTRSPLG